MKESINWNLSGIAVRTAIVELCGWRNRNGKATPMGLRIARTNWEKLTPSAKNVLEHHGISA
jgi:hypothetical protein